MSKEAVIMRILCLIFRLLFKTQQITRWLYEVGASLTMKRANSSNSNKPPLSTMLLLKINTHRITNLSQKSPLRKNPSDNNKTNEYSIIRCSIQILINKKTFFTIKLGTIWKLFWKIYLSTKFMIFLKIEQVFRKW